MLFILTGYAKSFVTFFTAIREVSRVPLFVVPLSMQGAVHFPTKVASVPLALMTPHVEFEVVTAVETFSTLGAEMGVLACVMLRVLAQTGF